MVLPFLSSTCTYKREEGREAGGCYIGWLLVSHVGELLAGKRTKRACTVSPKVSALPSSLLPLQPIFAASRLSSLSKRWPCEFKVGEWPGLRT